MRSTKSLKSARAGDIIEAVGTASNVAAAEIVTLGKDLNRVNGFLAAAKDRYQSLKDDGVNPAAASMQQLQRRIDVLEASANTLQPKLDAAKKVLQDTYKPTKAASDAFRVLKQETEQVDTRFLSFRERGGATQGCDLRTQPRDYENQ